MEWDGGGMSGLTAIVSMKYHHDRMLAQPLRFETGK
jgi:hypothetical protein